MSSPAHSNNCINNKCINDTCLSLPSHLLGCSPWSQLPTPRCWQNQTACLRENWSSQLCSTSRHSMNNKVCVLALCANAKWKSVVYVYDNVKKCAKSVKISVCKASKVSRIGQLSLSLQFEWMFFSLWRHRTFDAADFCFVLKFSGQKPLFNVLLIEVQHYFGTIFDSCNNKALKTIEIWQSFNPGEPKNPFLLWKRTMH